MQTIAVVDYGMGNLRSVVNALEVVGDKRDRVLLTSDPQQLGQADRVVFPGQGAARDCMRAIDVCVRPSSVPPPAVPFSVSAWACRC